MDVMIDNFNWIRNSFSSVITILTLGSILHRGYRDTVTAPDKLLWAIEISGSDFTLQTIS